MATNWSTNGPGSVWSSSGNAHFQGMANYNTYPPTYPPQEVVWTARLSGPTPAQHLQGFPDGPLLELARVRRIDSFPPKDELITIQGHLRQ